VITETGSKIAKKAQNLKWKTKVKWEVFSKTVNTYYIFIFMKNATIIKTGW
jgi:hypothetical protein